VVVMKLNQHKVFKLLELFPAGILFLLGISGIISFLIVIIQVIFFQPGTTSAVNGKSLRFPPQATEKLRAFRHSTFIVLASLGK
jgi:hypothetical protein